MNIRGFSALKSPQGNMDHMMDIMDLLKVTPWSCFGMTGKGGVGPQKHVLVTGTLQQLPGDSKCLVHPIVGGHLTP